jgi:5'-nucleotidase
LPTATPLFERALLTNDDGIDAPGLAVLEEIAGELAREVWVVAPAHDQSGTSHAVSLHVPLRVAQLAERRFSVIGTPGDCAALAVAYLMRAAPPDIVLSGVNRGSNLGVETVLSGTVGAAMTAMLLGLPGLALSQAYSDREAVPWECARTLAPGVIRELMHGDWSRDACLNINFPACSPAEAGPLTVTRQGQGELSRFGVVSGRDPRGFDYHWLRLERAPREDAPDSEATAIAEGRISVTPLGYERTQDEVLARLRDTGATA